MKTLPLLLVLIFAATTRAADLPTVTVEHLYYLQARAERIRKLNADDMIAYCIAQKIGGSSFENLYSQLFTMRIEVTKLLKIDGVDSNDPRVQLLNKTHEEYTKLLRDEARRIQNGIDTEGQVASDALRTIGRAQQQ
jgi:hypothetical protein